MIKASANDGELVILGLSAKNIELLQQGKPIIVHGNDLGIKNIQILIFAGDTEETMAKEMEQFIHPELRDGPEIPSDGPN